MVRARLLAAQHGSFGALSADFRNKPMGIAEYQLAEALPKDLEANLPSIEQIERELGEADE